MNEAAAINERPGPRLGFRCHQHRSAAEVGVRSRARPKDRAQTGEKSENALLGHYWLTATEIYLNLSLEDVLREFRENWQENPIDCKTPNRAREQGTDAARDAPLELLLPAL